ncbi:MAG TPA: permease-like cell division protein FtsX [Firmicutes bacterium]|nr:permease-like cell division protein FtsX [Bacillota bacterium]
MKLRSVRYLTVEGLKNIWVNRLMSIASIGVLVACMLMMGVAIILSLNVDKALGQLEEQNVVMAYFEDTLSEEEARAACDQLAAISNVASAEFIPKDEGLERQMATMDEAQQQYFQWLEDDNPLPDAARVTLSDLSLFDTTVEQIQNSPGVASINESRDLAMTISSITNALTIAGIGVIALLLLIALVIVANTVRVTMYSRKLEISIMKAVGATNSFIRLPFVVEGVVLGILSAGITTGVVYLVYKAAMGIMQSALAIQPIPFSQFAWPLFGVFAGMGILTGLISSIFMISKYLRKEGSEFRAL